VLLTGIALNDAPLQMEAVIAVIAGIGLTVAVIAVLEELTQPVVVFLASA
jgi:hypothetical protein